MLFRSPTQAGYAPLTSIRRAIHDLTDKGLLFKTDRKRHGLYGRPEYIWSLLAVPAPDAPVAASHGVAPTAKAGGGAIGLSPYGGVEPMKASSSRVVSHAQPSGGELFDFTPNERMPL